MEYKIAAAKVGGRIAAPPSKSHTIRALFIAALASGKSEIIAPLESGDTHTCIAVCRMLGAAIEEIYHDNMLAKVDVWGTGGTIAHPQLEIDAENSGTTLYFALAIAALGTKWIGFTGDAQLRSRPLLPLTQSLCDLGADVEMVHKEGRLPIKIRGKMCGGHTRIECETSQYLSALLLASPLATEDTIIEVPSLNELPYIKMTLEWLQRNHIDVTQKDWRRFKIAKNQHYHPFRHRINGDYSSASFLLCAAAITGSSIEIENLTAEDTQGDRAILDMLQKMGAAVEFNHTTVTLHGPEQLDGGTFDLNETPDLLPVMAATLCYARTSSTLINVAHARIKETDRIAVMVRELKKMGAHIEERPDGIITYPPPLHHPPLHGAAVECADDHRVAMALTVAALGAEGETIIKGAECASITYPEFFSTIEKITQVK